MKNPFEGATKYGNIGNDNLFLDYSRTLTVWTFIKSFLPYMVPAFVLYLLVLIPKISYFLTFGEPLEIGVEAEYTLIVFGTAFLFGLGRANNTIAYYDVQAMAYKHDLNRQAAHSMGHQREVNDIRFAIMESYRKKFNKTLLFPSSREMMIEEKLFDRDTSPEFQYEYDFSRHGMSNKTRRIKPDLQEIINRANLRRRAFNLSEKTAEHVAAKQIADRKQRDNGGTNEYDEMVRRYKHRTTPEIRSIIENIQCPNATTK